MYSDGYGIGNTDAIASIVKHALNPIVSGELPMHRNMYDEQVLDEQRLKWTHLNPKAEETSALVLDIMKSGKLGGEKIDKYYAKHIIDTLFNEDGTRNDKTIADLKTPLQVKMDVAFKDVKMKDANGNPALKYDPEQKFSEILDCCGNDVDLKEFLIDHGLVPGLCVGGDGKVRDLGKIKDRIAGIRDNLQEIRDIQIAFPGSASALKRGLAELTGDSFQQGTLRNLAAAVNKVQFTKAPRMHALMRVENIFAGMLDFRRAVEEVVKKLNVGGKFAKAGDAGGGGPQSQFARTCAVGLLLSKLGPGFASRLPNIFQGKQFQKMQSFIDQTMTGLKSNPGFADLPPGAEDELIASDLVIGTLYAAVNVNLEKPMPALNSFAFEVASLDDPSYGYVLGELDSAMKMR